MRMRGSPQHTHTYWYWIALSELGDQSLEIMEHASLESDHVSSQPVLKLDINSRKKPSKSLLVHCVGREISYNRIVKYKMEVYDTKSQPDLIKLVRSVLLFHNDTNLILIASFKDLFDK